MVTSERARSVNASAAPRVPAQGELHCTSRMLKKSSNRLLTRAAQKRDSVLPGSYRAATVRERSPASLFQHPASFSYWEARESNACCISSRRLTASERGSGAAIIGLPTTR